MIFCTVVKSADCSECICERIRMRRENLDAWAAVLATVFDLVKNKTYKCSVVCSKQSIDLDLCHGPRSLSSSVVQVGS